MHIYVFTNLQSTSIHGYQEKRKKNRQDLEIIISRITARGKKEKSKKIIGQKKKKKKWKGQLRHTSFKKSRDMPSVGQKKKQTHRKMLQCYNYRECSIQSRANYKKINRQSGLSY